MTAMIAYKVHVKLGQAEFSAEGPEETIKDQLATFLELATRQAHPQNGHSNGTIHRNGNSSAVLEQSAVEVIQDARTSLNPDIIKRLFAEDDGLVSLNRLPVSDERDSDVLFLILLGYLAIRNQEKVKASELLAAAKKSGLSRLVRIDHTLDKFDQLVTRGGFKRGSWYCLTNPGQEHAEEVAVRMFNFG